MAAPRSLAWRIVPWVIPFLLIIGGLIFVTKGLANHPKSSGIAAPPNVRNVTVYHAPAWALRQVSPGTTSRVVDVEMVASKANGPTSYVIRAAIARVDSPVAATRVSGAPADSGGSVASVAPVSDTVERTVVTCVRWDVDVSSGVVTERGAVDLSSRPGSHGIGNASNVRSECATTVIP